MKAVLVQKSSVLPVSTEFLRSHFCLSESNLRIDQILKTATEYIELQTGLSLVRKTWKVVHNNDCFVLPYGPVVELVSVQNSAGLAVSPLKVKRVAESLAIHLAPKAGSVSVVYIAGYTQKNLPDCIKNLIVEKFWDLYSQDLDFKLSSHSFSNHLFASLEGNCYAKF